MRNKNSVFVSDQYLAKLLLLVFLMAMGCGGIEQTNKGIQSDNELVEIIEYQKIHIIVPQKQTAIVKNSIATFSKRIGQRSGAKFVNSKNSALTITLKLQPDIGNEGYQIIDGNKREIVINGNDELGLLYGLGKFLHTSELTTTGLIPSSWRGKSVPSSEVRGIYIACHFNNFYEAAPIDEVQTYIEDLAFWGVNAVVFNFPQWQYDSFQDPNARKNINRIRLLMEKGKKAGLKVGLLECENQGFKTAPKNTLNTPFPDDLKQRGNLGTSLCASKEPGHGYLIDFWNQMLNEFEDIDIDYLVFWPYDEGGCGCDQCWPWGAKGHINLAEELMGMAHERWPKCKSVLSTWMYDEPDAGEWKGLYQRMTADPKLVDYVMADAHESFPSYPLENPIPNKTPLLNFPEISMWGMRPWGGYGANPLPNRFQTLWNQVSPVVSGGFPYSEGIYEDINKVICSQFYWNSKNSANETVRAYIAAYFSPKVVDSIAKAVEIMEENHERYIREDFYIDFSDTIKSTQVALDLMKAAEKKLTPQARQSWRWRILYLRASIDNLLAKTDNELRGEGLKVAFEELTKIYHAQNTLKYNITPPKVRR